jgi:predicted metal-dependent hydrolase
MNGSVAIIRRSVKHARLRVRQNSSVELVVPKDWQAGEIDRLLDRKVKWIRDKQAFFRKRERDRLTVGSNEIMLFGELFRVEIKERLDTGVEVDRVGRRLRVARASASNTYIQAWQRKFARAFLLKRTREFSEKHRIEFGRLFVRSQRTKWGGCSAKGNISLNWRLISVPERVIDYVILHELLHTKVMNHSQTFWVHLRALCPWAKEAITWLNANQPATDLKLYTPEV